MASGDTRGLLFRRVPGTPLPLQIDQQSEFAPGAPSIHVEIVVQREYLTAVHPVRQIDQAGVGEVHWHITILLHQFFDRTRLVGEPDRRLENTSGNVSYDCLGCSANAAQQVTSFGDHGLTGSERSNDVRYCLDTLPVIPFISIQQSDDYTGVE